MLLIALGIVAGVMGALFLIVALSVPKEHDYGRHTYYHIRSNHVGRLDRSEPGVRPPHHSVD